MNYQKDKLKPGVLNQLMLSSLIYYKAITKEYLEDMMNDPNFWIAGSKCICENHGK